jgi:hypothetical protein
MLHDARNSKIFDHREARENSVHLRRAVKSSGRSAQQCFNTAGSVDFTFPVPPHLSRRNFSVPFGSWLRAKSTIIGAFRRYKAGEILQRWCGRRISVNLVKSIRLPNQLMRHSMLQASRTALLAFGSYLEILLHPILWEFG